MPRASRRNINKEINLEINENFLFLISSLKQTKEIDVFFTDFLTKEEKKMIPKRLMLHLMLFNKIPNTKINSLLGISYETIRTHKNNWEMLDEDYKKIIARLSRRKSVKDLIKKINKKTEKLDNFLHSKSDMKARSKVLSVE